MQWCLEWNFKTYISKFSNMTVFEHLHVFNFILLNEFMRFSSSGLFHGLFLDVVSGPCLYNLYNTYYDVPSTNLKEIDPQWE